MKMLRPLSLFLSFLLASFAYADCDFKTGQYVEKLQDPSYIQSIQVNVPKSAKYTKNFIKILTSYRETIPPDLKKKFKAKVTINYLFGKCTFKATVRQNGDKVDHLDFLSGGHPYRSLIVKLNTGNVVSAVKFKLLIPATRNGENEILTSLILKRLGIISPETFAVAVDVNGAFVPMLFQEDARKELLEKNYRREGAIFEGDEELLWSFEDFKLFELENISLSRMTNKNWFEKGNSSQAIALSAYSLLQSAYSDYATNFSERQRSIVHPNYKDRSEFSEYMLALLAMNGLHALRPHNRKFYFNSITSKFEPIYYDGNTSFELITNKIMGIHLDTFLSTQFNANVDPNFIKRISELLKSDELKVEFVKRVEPLNKTQIANVNFDKFYDNAIAQYLTNVQFLDNKISNMFVKPTKYKLNKQPEPEYLNLLKTTKISQKIISKLEKSPGGYLATFQSGLQKYLSIKEVSRVITKNHLDNERTVFLGDYVDNPEWKTPVTKVVSFAEKLTTSAGVKVSVSVSDKVLTLTQTNQDDWVLIQSGDLNGWKILFNGVETVTNSKLLTDQRFNKYGLSGCLNLYDSKFQNTIIEVVGGGCEDSVNIITSTGSIDSISVSGAFADALDIDFSVIRISKVNIQDAGNDCLDVSGGRYQVDVMFLINCDDKGVSVGEGSTLFAKGVELNSANIGVSSKDLSQVEILDAQFKDVTVCIEIMQKKQEFGGASLMVANLKCAGIVDVDKNSVYKVGSY